MKNQRINRFVLLCFSEDLFLLEGALFLLTVFRLVSGFLERDFFEWVFLELAFEGDRELFRPVLVGLVFLAGMGITV
jgi:hypothetical protein